MATEGSYSCISFTFAYMKKLDYLRFRFVRTCDVYLGFFEFLFLFPTGSGKCPTFIFLRIQVRRELLVTSRNLDVASSRSIIVLFNS
jgi:hypothetical protein